MKYTGRPHDGEGRGPSDEDGLRASNIFEGGPSPEQQEMLSELNAIGRWLFQPSDVPAVESLLAGIGDGDSSGAPF